MLEQQFGFSDYAERVLGQYGAMDVDLQENGARFLGSYSHLELSAARVFKIKTNMGWLTKRRANAPKQREHFVLTLLQSGSFAISQRGHTSQCEPGSISFLSDSAVLDSVYHGEVEVLAIRFPAQLIRAYHRSADHICGTAVLSGSGCSGAIKDILLRLWADHSRLSPFEADSLTSCIIRLLQGAFSSEINEQTDARPSHHLIRLRQVIDREYPNPQLSARLIARKLDLSEGYLHEVARSSGNTIGEMVFEKRLQECKSQLADPAMKSRNVTDIALGAGFTSLSHFSRRFKERFGQSPREFRDLLPGQTG